ncbi:cell wall hydrolase [Parasphingorhabdus cellanae]|uniref:Cell wall hydrolase n=1 Tax=Parasphingorhabdus cellanae TaxID=2806553 RepID=A0ABX7T3C3_9SPHN|nr:cell wall hydrolase [Parasphingorhabdus cellanae]QTD54750.1 cell wall hydrolase [Parasphingorhabdus cellanae]
MSKIFKTASVVSLAFSAVAALAVTDASFALEANDDTPEMEIVIDPDMLDSDENTPGFETVIFGEQQEVVSEIPQDVIDADREANEERAAVETVDFTNDGASSLRQLVKQQSVDGALSEEMQCLAGTVYFESKGETLAGQLAVARVVMARAASSRFPDSLCGVVYQRKQFSFIRGGKMPRINKGHRHWRNAVAIAKIAMNDGWKSPVEGALFFHARYVSPGWRLKRMATIDNHIFYR